MELTSRQERAVALIFAENERSQARQLIQEGCSNNLPFSEKRTADQLDRIRFAVVKHSKGDLERLKKAIALAQGDWRDLYMMVGFGHDVQEHNHWFDRGCKDKSWWKFW